MILSRKFYQRNTLKVAQDLLGCILVRKIKRKVIRVIITETEAYKGEKDLASHASKGRTPRTELMFGEAGQAYIYLIYGMYHCLNIVTEKKDYPAAVLIRAVKIDGIDYKKTNGPGKVCRELKIDKVLNNWDIAQGKKLWIERGVKISPKDIKKAKRIGVDYARHCKKYLWRFYFSNG
jgi:DNA-3-methyladenine glycosylase